MAANVDLIERLAGYERAELHDARIFIASVIQRGLRRRNDRVGLVPDRDGRVQDVVTASTLRRVNLRVQPVRRRLFSCWMERAADKQAGQGDKQVLHGLSILPTLCGGIN